MSFASRVGALDARRFHGRVPDDAPYAAKQVLDIRSLHVYDDAANPQELPSIGQRCDSRRRLLGRYQRQWRYNAPDATLVQRLIGQVTNELVAFQQLDPRLLADVTLNQAIQANDTTGIQRAIGQVPVNTIPPLPDGLGSASGQWPGPADLHPARSDVDARETRSPCRCGSR